MNNHLSVNARKVPARLLLREVNQTPYGGRLVDYSAAGVFFGHFTVGDDELKTLPDGATERYRRAVFHCVKSQGLKPLDRLMIQGQTFDIDAIIQHDTNVFALNLSRRVS